MIKLFSLLLTITILTSSSLFAKGWIVPPTSLPQKASAYIKSTYPVQTLKFGKWKESLKRKEARFLM